MGEFLSSIPAELLQAVREMRCVLFVGAGLSVSVMRLCGRTLPTWKELICELLEFAKRDGFAQHTADVTELIAEHELVAAAQLLQDHVPPEKLQQYFLEIFGDPGIHPTVTHKAIPPLPFRAILTSNYDSLVEDAFYERSIDPLVFTYNQFHKIPSPLRKPRFFICKLHGDYKDYESVILSERDYARILYLQPGYRKLIEHIFLSYVVLFVGFSGTDPDLNRIIDQLEAEHPGKYNHYIALPKGARAPAILRYWAMQRGVHAVEYEPDPKHTQVLALLKDLGHLPLPEDAPTFPSPSVLVTGHDQDFNHIQAVWETLRGANYRCIIQPTDGFTHAWFQGMRNSMLSSDVAIHLISNHNRKVSDIVIAVGKSLGKEVIPVVIGPVEPPHILSGLPYYAVPAHDPGPNSYGFLLDVMRSITSTLTV